MNHPGCKKHMCTPYSQENVIQEKVTTSMTVKVFRWKVSCPKSLYLHPPLVQLSWPGEKKEEKKENMQPLPRTKC